MPLTMKLYSIIFLVFMLTCCNGEGDYPVASSIDIISQSQSHYENGKRHGSQIKESIHFQIESWEQGISSHLNIDRDSMHHIVYKHSGFLDAIKSHTPALLDEIHGIADGAELDRDLVLFYNLGEEIFNFCKAHFESCSNIAYDGKSKNVLSYNQDLPAFLHGKNRPVILKHLNHYVFTMPGNIALSGVSERLGVSCNSLPMLQMNVNGLPLPFFIRKLLELKNLKDIKRFINKTPLAIGQNLMIISEEEINNIEISSNQVKWLSPQHKEFYYHTNFPLENIDYNSANYKPSTCKRFQFLDAARSKLALNPSNKMMDQLRDLCAKPPIKNDQTFLRFVVIFKENSKPNIEFTNPHTQETINLNL